MAEATPGGSAVENPPANAGDAGSIPASGRSLGEGNGNPLQCSCLEDPMNRGAWRATVHGIAESDVTERLNNSQWLKELALDQGQAGKAAPTPVPRISLPHVVGTSDTTDE